MAAQVATERLGNLGYGALIKEVTVGTPLTPTTFFPLYKSTLNTDMKYDEDNPIMGVRSNPFALYQGVREHMGQLQVLAEANTAEYWFDMLLAAGSITGGNPYTHPFTEGLSNSYTIDVLKGQVVERYFGCMIETLEGTFNKNKQEFLLDVSALGSFSVRKIATVSTVTLTLDTAYDPAPTKGLVAGDNVRILAADNSNVLDTTIAVGGVNADGITITLSASAAAFATGDTIFLRQQTPSYSLVTSPFEWARTQFQFGTTASAAFSASQLAQETGAKYKLTHKFEKKGGSDRSGSYDPRSLPRLQTEADITLKTFFDQPTQNLLKYFESQHEALVIRQFAVGSSYELRLMFDEVGYKMHKRDLDSGKIIYADVMGRPVYNSANGELMNVKVINALSS